MTPVAAVKDGPTPVVERYSGHESFACRYGWLTKIYRLVQDKPEDFQDLDAIMVTLGLGKNMAKSLRFWAGAFGLVVDTSKRAVVTTAFADWLLDPKNGADPYLEDPANLWLLHWRLRATAHLGVWQLLFFDTPETETLRSRIRERLMQRAALAGRPLAANTLKQHVDVFLSTYADRTSHSANALEHVLACPLQELGLIGVRSHGRADDVIELSRAARRIDTVTLARVIYDYWRLRAPHDRTVSLSSLLLDIASPGLVLRMEEGAFTDKIHDVATAFPKAFRYTHGIERQTLTCVPDTLASIADELGYV